jgi:PKHD-type hydroxylase
LLYQFPERLEKTASGKPALLWPDGAQPFGAAVQIGENSAVHEVVLIPEALTDEERRRVRELGEALQPVTAQLERGNAAEYRASTIAWIEPRPEAHWLYHRLGMLFLEANRRYRFELAGFMEALQYTVYGPADKFDWHIDLGPDSISARKLSLSVLLNDAAEYDGGQLEFMNVTRSGQPLPAGTAVFFPSYMAHRVAPIGRGVRRSLVAWGYGPPFR